MKRLRKVFCIFGMMIITMGVLSACTITTHKSRSTPEVSLENYMKTVKAGEIEKSHEFIHGVVISSFSDYSMGESVIDDEWREKIKGTKGYKTYENEMMNVYNELEYEITSTHEREGFDQKEYTIDLKIADLDGINEKVIDEIESEYLERMQTPKSEDLILNDIDGMYAKYATELKDARDSRDTITGHIIFIENATEDNTLIKEWTITGMDFELFNRLSKIRGL